VLPQSPTHIKVLFYNIHCVDVHIRSEGLVSIRDGSFSMFDQTKVLTDLEPIRGFKAFLYKYVDEAFRPDVDIDAVDVVEEHLDMRG
jgi:hypothetical protein